MRDERAGCVHEPIGYHDLSDVVTRADGGVVSLEVRWMHPGRVPVLLAERLEPFGEGVEVREDCYLTAPTLPDVSVKMRGGVRLDVKAFRYSPGRLSLPGGTRGRMEMWEKWSFPLADAPRPPLEGASWTRVLKARRRRSFAVVDGILVERPLTSAASAGCSLELTEANIEGEMWWTLGLEAVGSLESLHRDLQAVAMTLIDDRLSARFGLHSPASMSYQERLRTRRNDAWPSAQEEARSDR